MGFAVTIANEEIKIAIAIDISHGQTGHSVYIRYSEGRVPFLLGVSRSARRTGIAEEGGVAFTHAEEKIKIAIGIGIGKDRAGAVANICYPERSNSSF